MKDPVLASRVFGVYLAIAGTAFAVAPDAVLPLLGFPVPTDAWIHLVGLLTAILGMYFVYCARPEMRRFFVATVIARCMFFTGIVAFALGGLVSPLLVSFGVVDLIGAAWTLVALQASRTVGPVR